MPEVANNPELLKPNPEQGPKEKKQEKGEGDIALQRDVAQRKVAQVVTEDPEPLEIPIPPQIDKGQGLKVFRDPVIAAHNASRKAAEALSSEKLELNLDGAKRVEDEISKFFDQAA